MRLAGNVPASKVATVPRRMSTHNLLAVELGEQNVSDRVQYVLGRPREQVRDSHQHSSLAEADGVVDIGKREELDVELGEGSSWT